jgi:hypothetical protein
MGGGGEGGAIFSTFISAGTSRFREACLGDGERVTEVSAWAPATAYIAHILEPRAAVGCHTTVMWLECWVRPSNFFSV